MAVFLDTNIVIYAFADEDHRSRKAQELMEFEFEISAQVLNEFINVSLKKLGRSWRELVGYLDDIREAVETVHPLTDETTRVGVYLAQRYNLAVYDSMLAAAALIAGCTVLYSEDMHHGLVIEDRLTILNPFA